MDMGWIGMLGLVGLLAYQQHFYAQLVKQLVERLMARDLREYEQVKNPPPPRVPVKLPPVPDESFDRIIG